MVTFPVIPGKIELALFDFDCLPGKKKKNVYIVLDLTNFIHGNCFIFIYLIHTHCSKKEFENTYKNIYMRYV